jgi:hypothetical protein
MKIIVVDVSTLICDLIIHLNTKPLTFSNVKNNVQPSTHFSTCLLKKLPAYASVIHIISLYQCKNSNLNSIYFGVFFIFFDENHCCGRIYTNM